MATPWKTLRRAVRTGAWRCFWGSAAEASSATLPSLSKRTPTRVSSASKPRSSRAMRQRRGSIGRQQASGSNIPSSVVGELPELTSKPTRRRTSFLTAS
jgi:hypothetical protein